MTRAWPMELPKSVKPIKWNLKSEVKFSTTSDFFLQHTQKSQIATSKTTMPYFNLTLQENQ